MIVWLRYYCKRLNGMTLLFGHECVTVARGTVVRLDILAQATLSRLGETCRNKP